MGACVWAVRDAKGVFGSESGGARLVVIGGASKLQH
jgi:hypothetical protein